MCQSEGKILCWVIHSLFIGIVNDLITQKQRSTIYILHNITISEHSFILKRLETLKTTSQRNFYTLCPFLTGLWLSLTWWFWRRILIWLWNDCNWSLYFCGTWPGIPEISAILFFSVDNFVFLVQNAQFGRFLILSILFPHLTLLSVSKDTSWSLKVLRCSLSVSHREFVIFIFCLDQVLQKEKAHAALLRSRIGSQLVVV